MKATPLVTVTAAVAITLCMASTAPAGDAAETRNLFKDAGPKQTSRDFKPAPDKIETNFGTLHFELEAFPDEATVQKIYDEMDLSLIHI